MRLPIAAKVTVAIAILLLAFMGWQTRTAIRIARTRADAEINERGVVLVTAVSNLLENRWASAERGTSSQSLTAMLESFVRSQPQITTRILNVVVYDDTGSALATAMDQRRFRLGGGRILATQHGVTIAEHTYEGRAVRSYSRDLGREGGPGGALTRGRAELYLSASDIEASLARLARTLLLLSSAACTAAVLACFLLARLLTRPILKLHEDIRRVSRGDLRHQSSVSSADELGDLGRALNAMTAGLRAAEQVKLKQRSVERELAIATQIQEALLPSVLPDVRGLDIATSYVPAKEIGGDYYDFFRTDEHHLAVAVADVSGKSIPGALVMTMTRSLLRLAAAQATGPMEVVRLVQRFLTPDVTPGMFVTLLYFVVDLRTFEVALVRCGHNPPMLYQARNSKVLRLHPEGLALCLDRSSRVFDSKLQVQRLRLDVDDAILCYTDGVTEATNAKGTPYSEERLAAVFLAAAGPSASVRDAVIADVSAHRGQERQSDDITLVALRRCS